MATHNARGESLSTTAGELPTEMRIARELEKRLAGCLPPDWSLAAEPTVHSASRSVSLLATVTCPRGENARLAVDISRRVEPHRVADLVRRLREAAGGDAAAVPVLGASYLSPRSRALLRDAGVGYVDLTGNLHIAVSAPGLFICADGAGKDPWPRRDRLQSLRGRGAVRAVRAIVDVRPPFGVRELAERTATPAPTLSRVLELLRREGVVSRDSRGRVVAVDWEGVIRRWAHDYDQIGSNTVTTVIEPRGVAALRRKLPTVTCDYAASGAFAAQYFDPVGPAKAASLYVADVVDAMQLLDLVETDIGANVLLLEPPDPVAFERTVVRDGVRCVAPSQLAADLLTGVGREPSQGEQLLKWMGDNEDEWRT